MRLNEAIAIYLYLQRNETISAWNAELMRKVVKIIDDEAEKAIHKEEAPPYEIPKVFR